MNTLPGFTTLRTAAAFARANERFVNVLKRAASRAAKQTIGTAGGSQHLMTWHVPALDLWVACQRLNNRTWNALGIGDPFSRSKVAPVLEINFPLRAGSSTTAGLALLDPRGVLAVAHSGRVGGGRPGIGMNAFKAYHPLSESALVDGRRRDLYFLGDLSAPSRLAHNVSDFVHTVDDFKNGRSAVLRSPPVHGEFHPEFEGATDYTLNTADRTATYTHGRVVNSLYRALRELSVQAQRTRLIDLFAAPAPDRAGVIFEVKTACDPQSLYTCVGQLTLLPHDPHWYRVAVLPSPVARATVRRLEDVGVWVLEYALKEGAGAVEFVGLGATVRRLQQNQTAGTPARSTRSPGSGDGRS